MARCPQQCDAIASFAPLSNVTHFRVLSCSCPRVKATRVRTSGACALVSPSSWPTTCPTLASSSGTYCPSTARGGLRFHSITLYLVVTCCSWCSSRNSCLRALLLTGTRPQRSLRLSNCGLTDQNFAEPLHQMLARNKSLKKCVRLTDWHELTVTACLYLSERMNGW